MKYNKLFSYCLEKDVPNNIHQFHYIKASEEPTTLDWENWIVGKLYSNTQISFFEDEFKHIDLSSAKDKKTQLRDFLDYHYLSYGDICFLIEIRELIEYAENVYTNQYQISHSYMGFVNNVVLDWCKEKESQPVSSKTKPTKNIQSNREEKKFKDYLLCDEEQKEAIMNKLYSILDGAKGKRIATVLFALRELSFLILEVRGKAKIYRTLEIEFGLTGIASGVNRYITTDITPISITQTEIEDLIKILN